MQTQWSSRNPLSSIPLLWKRRVSIEDLSKSLTNMEESQVIVNDLYLNEDEDILQNRADVVQWIFSVSRELNLKNETAFKSIHILDQYLSQSGKVSKVQSMKELHFTAVVCLNLAAKMEEINCNYLKYFQENLTEFSLKEFVQKEMEVLKVLKFKLSFPGIDDFINIFLQISINEINSFYSKISTNKAEMDHVSNSRNMITSLITFINNITKYFLQMKESVFTSQIASGLICFEAALLALRQHLRVDISIITELIMKKVRFIINDDELVTNCHFIAYNFLLGLIEDHKSNSSTKATLNDLRL